ncbi:MAG: hypothetical protein SAK29_12990, partial [Scytonema sp. PMC 1069.18]|nr:hypothetical protein [Scytonema sp. PMC 1069.18]
MTEWQFQGIISRENQYSLQRLIRAIALSQGQFALILVRCNYRQLQDEILMAFRSYSQELLIQEFCIPPSINALHSAIATEIYPNHSANSTHSLPSALMVFGLESVISLEDLLIDFNQARDIYPEIFPFPLVLWLTDEVAALLSRLAPDFKSWAATTIKFEMGKQGLISLVRQETESLFAKILDAGIENFVSNTALDLGPKTQLQHRYEIEVARNDLLRLYGITLEPELEASLEFVLGRESYANDEIDRALSHYYKSLTLWQSRLDNERGSGLLSITLSPPLRKAIVLFHIGLCYRRMADLHPSISSKYWQDALVWFQQCLEELETAQRQDLVAKFIVSACEMLQRLQAWEDLLQMTQRSLKLHETYGTKAQIAQDYGFLASVAISKSQWLQAYKLANLALTIAESVPDISRQQESWYLLLLGRTQRQLGELDEAVNNLEWAKVVCELQYEPSLYLEILEELRSLYFLNFCNYLDAFYLKKEKIQIEHQYGYRSFIGASQLQPQHHRINPIQNSQKILSSLEGVAQEIATSGRQKDVNRLIERIARADCKVTVIYGPSGVGKSSTLKAGLIPILKHRVIGDRLPLTILLSVYTNWITSISHNLNQSISEISSLGNRENSPANIIEYLRLLTDRNYIIVLIFDQFEDFFFFYTSPQKRREFYKFLSDCLNIAYVKVILSTREDYLHY